MSKRKKAESAPGQRRSQQIKTKGSANQLPQPPTLDKLAEHAEAIRALGKQAIENTIKNIIEIGERLVDVRDNHLDHGEWLPWLKREFAWSRQTADRFI